jgi:hypothetical protein
VDFYSYNGLRYAGGSGKPLTENFLKRPPATISREVSRGDSTCISEEIKYMQTNLVKCHRQFNTGLIFHLIGFAGYLAGSIIATDNPESTRPILLVAGAASIIGTIQMIASHRYIGYAGRGLNNVKNNSGIRYKLK